MTIVGGERAGPDAAAHAGHREARLHRVRLDSLTGMRWVAAFLVFGYHLQIFGFFGGRAEVMVVWAFTAGQVGVSFFFMLSGFVLGWTSRRPLRPLGFWRRRVARIYPLHVLTAVLALWLAHHVVTIARTPHKEAVANLLLVSGWRDAWWQAGDPVSWSLVCEAFFYAIFPLLFLVISRLGRRMLWSVAVLCLVSVVVIAWAADNGYLHVSPYSYPAARLPEFVLGVVLSQLLVKGYWRGTSLTTAAVVAIVGFFFCQAVQVFYSYAACTMIGFALIITALAARDRDGGPGLLRHPVMVRLGEWSFAFYLVHILVFQVAIAELHIHRGNTVLRGAGYTGLVLTVSIGCAALLHMVVERPAQRLITGRRRRDPESAAQSP